jgi:hypothetical protein
MPSLSLDTRAERRAKRRNKKLLERNPLLADEIIDGSLRNWLTTPAAEKEALVGIIESADDLFVRLAKGMRRNARRAATYRELVARYITPEQLAAADRQITAYPRDPVYAVEYWFKYLARVNPPEAHRRCANRPLHEGMRHFHDRCPCCGKPLNRIVEPPMPEQVKLEI